MSLNSKILVPLPETGIVIRRSSKHKYVYKVLKTYRNEKNQPTNEKKLIGKLDESGTMLIPNNTYWELYPDTYNEGDEESLVSIKEVIVEPISIGTYFLGKTILDQLGITNIINDVFGVSKAAKILTAALFMMGRGNVFECVDDWCNSFNPSKTMLTSQSASKLFASILYSERKSFFKSWINNQSKDEYYAYDVTSISSYSENINDAEWGYNRDHEKLPQINFGCYFAQGSKLPVYYIVYPGSIVDKSYLEHMTMHNHEFGIEKVCFIMDQGFCSTRNLKYMHANKYDYIMGANMSSNRIKNIIEEERGNITDYSNCISEGIYHVRRRITCYGVATNLNIFYSNKRDAEEANNIHNNIIKYGEILKQKVKLTANEVRTMRRYYKIELDECNKFTYSLDIDKVNAIMRKCGLFCIITNTDCTSLELLKLYRNKDTIEKGFDDLKNQVCMKRLRVHDSGILEVKMFCAFISLIIIQELTNRLRNENDCKMLDTKSLISQFDKVKLVEVSGKKRLLHPLTKKQKDILKKCRISEEVLESFVSATS